MLFDQPAVVPNVHAQPLFAGVPNVLDGFEHLVHCQSQISTAQQDTEQNRGLDPAVHYPLFFFLVYVTRVVV